MGCDSQSSIWIDYKSQRLHLKHNRISPIIWVSEQICFQQSIYHNQHQLYVGIIIS